MKRQQPVIDGYAAHVRFNPLLGGKLRLRRVGIGRIIPIFGRDYGDFGEVGFIGHFPGFWAAGNRNSACFPEPLGDRLSRPLAPEKCLFPRI